MKLNRDGVADIHLGGIAEERARGVGGDGIAAFEDFERAALLELEREAVKPFALGAQKALGANAEIGGTFFQSETEGRQFHAKIV